MSFGAVAALETHNSAPALLILQEGFPYVVVVSSQVKTVTTSQKPYKEAQWYSKEHSRMWIYTLLTRLLKNVMEVLMFKLIIKPKWMTQSYIEANTLGLLSLKGAKIS